MADGQRSLGGVGKRAAGASPHTIVMWDYIDAHPGVTRDELKAKALELDWVPRGYAHRYYAGQRNEQKSIDSKASAVYSVADIARTRSDDAVRAVVARVLQTSTRDGMLRRDESGGYHAVRRPRATGQVEARVRPRDEVVADIALREVRRALLAFGRERLMQPHAKLSLDIRRKLDRWLEASEMVEERPDQI